MITSKQRAFLRPMANSLDTTLMVGKDGTGDGIMRQADDVLAVHELVKGEVLETAGITTCQVADGLATPLSAEVVQVIGGKFTLYCRNQKEPKIILPRPAKK